MRYEQGQKWKAFEAKRDALYAAETRETELLREMKSLARTYRDYDEQRIIAPDGEEQFTGAEVTIRINDNSATVGLLMARLEISYERLFELYDRTFNKTAEYVITHWDGSGDIYTTAAIRFWGHGCGIYKYAKEEAQDEIADNAEAEQSGTTSGAGADRR